MVRYPGFTALDQAHDLIHRHGPDLLRVLAYPGVRTGGGIPAEVKYADILRRIPARIGAISLSALMTMTSGA